MSVLAAAAGEEIATVFVDLGLLILALALLARAARAREFSPIPLYLLGGLAFAASGFPPGGLSEDFIEVGAEIGIILLLFLLGLEYSGDELRQSMRDNMRAGLLDLALSFPPGLGLGLLLGWDAVAAVLLGGVTYISSSGIVAKTLADLGRLGNRETPQVLSILVFEDLAMTVYLPLVAVLIVGGGLATGLLNLAIAVIAAVVVLALAMRYGEVMSRVVSNRSDEVLLLTVFGLILLVAGLAQRLQVSSAIGAFLVGIAVSGPVAQRARELLTPLRDLFAAVFFVFFGLQIEVAQIPAVAGAAVALGVVTAATKLATGWWAARRAGIRTPGRLRAGATLVARGEFSIVIAGIGVSAGLEPDLGPLAAAYVLFTALAGSLAARWVDPLVVWAVNRRPEPDERPA